MANAREDLLNQIRFVLGGQEIAEPPASDVDLLSTWFDESMARWKELVQHLPAADPKRLPRGHYAIAYKLIGNLRVMRPAELKEAIRRATIHHTGWPEFWVPNREDIQPYIRHQKCRLYLFTIWDQIGTD